MVLASWFIVHNIAIIWIGLNDKIEHADVIVVLGNKVELDGKPSQRLQKRLDRAADLYLAGISKHIIVSGGFGKEGYEEAIVMRDTLVKTGIPSASVIMDKDGYNTFKTVVNSKKIMKAKGFKSVIVISQYYHIARTRMAFKKIGIKPVFSAHARMWPELREPFSLVREFAAFYYYALRNYQ